MNSRSTRARPTRQRITIRQSVYNYDKDKTGAPMAEISLSSTGWMSTIVTLSVVDLRRLRNKINKYLNQEPTNAE